MTSQFSQTLMKPGSWTIDLDRKTPEDVMGKVRLRRSQTNFAGFSTLLVLETHVDPSVGADALREACVYAGVYRTRQNGYTLEGAGLETYLGDEDGRGLGGNPTAALAFDVHVFNAAGLGQTGVDAIPLGFVDTPGGTFQRQSDAYVSGRDLLQEVCEQFDREWRIDVRRFQLDARTITGLYGTDPAAFFHATATSDPNHSVLDGTLDVYESVEDFTHRMFLQSSTSIAGDATHPDMPEWCSPWYSTATAADRFITREQWVRTGGDEASGTLDDRAAAMLGSELAVSSINVKDCTTYKRSDFLLGKFIGVYSPAHDIFDRSAAQVWLGGELCTPLTTRVQSIECEIRPGDGVYLVDSDGSAAFGDRTVTDLSRWVIANDRPTSRIACGQIEPTWATGARRKYDEFFGG